jgi:hypothetical protein
MPATPQSTSPVVLPTVSTPPGNLPISPTSRSILNEIIENGQASLFQNPVAQNINQLSSGISGLYSAINNSTCLNYTAEQKTSVLTALTGTGGLSEQVTSFTTHVETLSGLITGTNGSTPNLETVLSVGRSLKDLANTIDQASGCIGLLGNMTGLFSGEILNGYSSQLAGLIEQVNGCLADLTAILDEINAIKAAIAGIIAADQNYFNSALELLRQAALSSLLDYMFNDPCGRFVLETQIGKSGLLSKFLR